MSSFVMVPVPEDRVQEVYMLLAFPTGGDDASSGLGQVWSDEEIGRAYRETKGNIRGVVDHLASQPGEPVRADELYTQLGLSPDQFKGVMGAFGKVVKNRYKKSRPFFDASWEQDLGMVVYRMNNEVAEIILKET